MPSGTITANAIIAPYGTSYTFLVGVTSLPLPEVEGIRQEQVPIGAAIRMADGTYRSQYITVKWRVQLEWKNMTSNQRSTILSTYRSLLSTSATVTLPSGLSFVALSEFASYTETPISISVGTIYDITFAIVEV